MIYTDDPKFAFIVTFRPEKDITNLKCRSNTLRKIFELLIDKTWFEKIFKIKHSSSVLQVSDRRSF